MSYPIANDSAVNINLYDAVEHQAPIDNVFTTGRPTFERSNDYVVTREQEDGRHQMFERNPLIDYQDDPFAPAFIPGEFTYLLTAFSRGYPGSKS
jgi:hypothetical protein